MSRLVFLLEEYSMKVLLEGLVPRLHPELRFLCVPHEGKRDLESSIPHKLKAWRERGVQFCVVRDNDGADCRALKQRLVESCRAAGKPGTLVRLACQELEAWYFGEPEGLNRAFGRQDLGDLHRRARFRDPDAVAQPGNALAELVDEFQKVSGARRMAEVLTRNNRSRSFQVFIAGIDRLAAAVSSARRSD